MTPRTRTGYYQDKIDGGAYTVTAEIFRDGGIRISVTLITATPGRAAEAAARLPKGVGARATTLTGCDYYDREVRDPRYGHVSGPHRDGDYMHGWTVGQVKISFNLLSNGVTGSRNETALKRYRSFRRNAAKLGIPVVFEDGQFGNSVKTEDDLESLLADYAKAA
jgi:hypothetical protein